MSPTFRELVGDTYKVIKGYVPREEALRYAEKFREEVSETLPYSKAGKLINDSGFDVYNHIDHLAILTGKNGELNELLGESVLPTYCFTRMYTDGGVLLPHKDRPQCEVSLSIHFDGDAEWEFCIEDKDGKPVKLLLEPGDAVLYDAPNADHWREDFTGTWYVQTFHHYVFVSGNYSGEYFDTGNLSSRKESYEVKALSEHIKVYDDLVQEDSCEDIIDYACEKKKWHKATVTGDDEGTSDYRKCMTFALTKEDDPEIDNQLWTIVSRAIQRYSAEFPHLNISQDEGYAVLRYEETDKYDVHTDHCAQYNRHITIIINLNDDFEGGKLTFFNGKYSIPAKTGNVIIFPSNYMFPHAVTPVTSGVRYSMITWAV